MRAISSSEKPAASTAPAFTAADAWNGLHEDRIQVK